MRVDPKDAANLDSVPFVNLSLNSSIFLGKTTLGIRVPVPDLPILVDESPGRDPVLTNLCDLPNTPLKSTTANPGQENLALESLGEMAGLYTAMMPKTL